MGKFDQTAFESFVIDSNIVGFSEKLIRFVSGRECNCYVNWRVALNDVFLVDELVQHTMKFIETKVAAGELARPDCIYGVPDAATKLGILLQYTWAKNSPNYGKGSHVLSMGRKTPKEHGKAEDRFFVGMPRGKTLVVEDTSTTGGSIVETLDRLIEAEVEIVGALGLTNRMEKTDEGLSVEQAIATRKSNGKPVKYYAMSTLPGLLPALCKKLNPTAEMKTFLEGYFERYGVQSVKLG